MNSYAETDVIVREGEAEITTPQGSTILKEGQQITVRGTDSPEYRVVEAPGRDDWDRWNKDRDSLIRQAEGWRRTNRYYTGVNDLDAYGHWDYVPGYGSVWAPAQTVGWSPYQYGRWVWEPYYGWTWVSYEPWGWAPYHYGRWFVRAGYWYWWPGPMYASYRPVYAPAYVFFIGFGHHPHFGAGFGSIGWLPCGPHDYFYPWYGRGFNRIHVTNIVNVTNITNVTNVNNVVVPPLHNVHGRQPLISNVNLAMTNPRIRQAITTVSMDDFGKGVAPSRHQGVDEVTIKQAQVVTGNLPVVPTRESLQPTNRAITPATANITPRSVDHFFAKTQPPAGPPAFQDQANRVQEVIRAHAGEAQTTVRNGNTASVPRGQGAEASTTVNGSLGAQLPTAGQQNSPAGIGRGAKPAGNMERPASATAETKGSDVPKSTGGTREGWRTFGRRPEGNSSTADDSHTFSGSESQKTVAQTSPDSASQKNSSGQTANTQTPSGSNSNGGRGDWRKFSPPNRGQATPEDNKAAPGSGNPPARADSPMHPANNPEDRDLRPQSPANQPPADKSSVSSGGRTGQQNEPAAPSSGAGKNTPPSRADSPAHRADSPEDREGWHKFPSAGNPPAEKPQTPQQPEQHNDRTTQAPGDSSNWHRFPSAGTDRSRSSDGPKPPLSVDKPIVTPRASEPRSTLAPAPIPRSEPRYSPPPPAPHVEPRSAPPAPAPRAEPRSSPPAPAPRSEPRSSPPSGSGNRGNSPSEPRQNHGKDN